MEQISYKLETFEGPLDLLLNLLSKNKLNIYDIPITILLEQYMAHIEAMKQQDMDIASEFMEMAARLIYLKTVSLLPKHDEIELLKDELAGELLEYEVCRQIASKFAGMTDGFDRYVRKPEQLKFEKTYELVHQKELIFDSYLAAVGRGQRKLPPPTTVFSKIVAKKIVAVSTKIVFVMRRLWGGSSQKLSALFAESQSRSELVATFLAVLELCKANRIKINGNGENISVKLVKEKKQLES